mgnify:CR=1 FL=1
MLLVEQTMKFENLFKEFNDVKAQEESLLSAKKALEEQLETTIAKLRKLPFITTNLDIHTLFY